MLDPHSGRSDDDALFREGRPEIGSMAELRGFLADRDDVSAVEVLLDGDRLRMVDRVARWMENRCYMLDPRTLIYETLPKVVAAGPTIEGSQDLDEWLESRIETAAGVLFEEDVRLALADAPVGEPLEPRFQFLMETLNFTPAEVRRVVVAVNQLRAGERHVFYHCFVIGKGFGRYEDEVGINATQAQALFKRAIDKLSDAVGDL
jgi:hypothetical protein